MMMPANFSVIAENEMAYVVGGSAATDWAKNFNTNMVTIVGNTFVSKLVGATLGTMFSGMWGDGLDMSDAFKAAYNTKGMNGFNKFLQVAGTGAAIYNLGTANVVNTLDDEHKKKDAYHADDKKVHFFGIDGMIASGKSTIEKYL